MQPDAGWHRIVFYTGKRSLRPNRTRSESVLSKGPSESDLIVLCGFGFAAGRRGDPSSTGGGRNRPDRTRSGPGPAAADDSAAAFARAPARLGIADPDVSAACTRPRASVSA